MEALRFIQTAVRRIGEIAHPTRCGTCGLLSDTGLCPTCRAEFEPAEPGFEWFGTGLPLLFRAAAFRYHGRAAAAVRNLKYLPNPFLFEPMALDMAAAFHRLPLPPCDVVVPVPIHPLRRIERGFNQAEILCSRIEADMRTDLLRRIRSTRPQAGLDIDRRRTNVRGAFSAHHAVEGLAVLLIDDVTTSGFTAFECGRELLRAGARSVGVLAYATGGQASQGEPPEWHLEP